MPRKAKEKKHRGVFELKGHRHLLGPIRGRGRQAQGPLYRQLSDAVNSMRLRRAASGAAFMPL